MKKRKAAKQAPKNTPHRVIYYRDEQNDEFSEAKITPKPIDGTYRYDRDSGLSRLLCFFWYRIVAVPIAFFYLKIALGHKVVGREKLKEIKKRGIFLFGNHTQVIGDALIPSFLRIPQKPYVIVHPNNVSMPYLGRVTPYMGAIPLPDGLAATRNFTKILEKRISAGKAIVIYPEAHIWPYYTGIRPFPDDAFLYPVKYDAPVYAFTNTYQKRRFSEKPRVVTKIDGPFYPKSELPPRERRADLRNRVYDCMTERAKESEVIFIEYRKDPNADKPDP